MWETCGLQRDLAARSWDWQSTEQMLHREGEIVETWGRRNCLVLEGINIATFSLFDLILLLVIVAIRRGRSEKGSLLAPHGTPTFPCGSNEDRININSYDTSCTVSLRWGICSSW
jgi:hypothetical protein